MESVGGENLSDKKKLRSVDISGGLMQQDISLNLLEGVANIRYGLLVVAKLLLRQVSKVDGAFLSDNPDISSAENQLVDKAHHLCTARSVNAIDITGNGNTTGPAVYLLKLIVRLAGFGELKKVADKHQWLIPENLKCEKVRIEGVVANRWNGKECKERSEECLSESTPAFIPFTLSCSENILLSSSLG